jgi:hypothetical protein
MMKAKIATLCVAAGLAFGFASTALAFPPAPAGYKSCYRANCVQRAPFVCHGPIGSCGFTVGKCVKHQESVFYMKISQSCYGSTDLGVK